MTKAKPEVLELKDLKTAAYKFAQSGETRRSIAAYILDRCPEFLDNMPDEVKNDLYEGFALRAHELWGQDYFVRGDTGMMVKTANSLDVNFAKREIPKGEVIVNVYTARSYSGQEFGRLRTSDGAMHGVVAVWRDKFSKYASNCMKDIQREIRRIQSGDKERERGATKSFAEWLTETFETGEKRVKVARDRGDETANQVKFRVACDAFWKAYKA